jgi:hypothetical protein
MSGTGPCHLHGCPREGVNTCGICGAHYCDQHILVAQLAGPQNATVALELCFADLGKATGPTAEHGTHVTNWYRKSDSR